MALRMVVFEGNQPAEKVRDFFRKTNAEVLTMGTEIFERQFFFKAIIEVDPKAFENYG